jgi:hypothetical protein
MPPVQRKTSRSLLSLIGLLLVAGLLTAYTMKAVMGRKPALPAKPPANYAAAQVPVSSFAGVAAWGPWEVTLTPADSCSVLLEGPSEMLAEAKASAPHGVLELSFRPAKPCRRGTLRASVGLPRLLSVEARESDITFTGFVGDSLFVWTSGSGAIRGSANTYRTLVLTCTDTVSVDLRASSFINAALQVNARRGEIAFTAAGGVVSGNLAGKVDVRYDGTAGVVQVARSKGARLRKR